MTRNNSGGVPPLILTGEAASECSPQLALSLPKGRKPWERRKRNKPRRGGRIVLTRTPKPALIWVRYATLKSAALPRHGARQSRWSRVATTSMRSGQHPCTASHCKTSLLSFPDKRISLFSGYYVAQQFERPGNFLTLRNATRISTKSDPFRLVRKQVPARRTTHEVG